MLGCPPPEQLERLLEEQLDDAGRRTVSAHVAGCDRCQEMLETLTEAGPVVAPARTEEPAPDFLARLKESPPASITAPGGRNGLVAPEQPAGTMPTVAGYEVLGEVGRGGMGVVYKARHRALNRLVALKMLLPGSHAGPRDLARLRQEAEAVARLHHPNIVQVHDVGEVEGRPFLALEFVAEGSLAHRLRGDPQPLKPAARLVETLARAVHAAHQKGIIHRDLKPANILLQREEGGRRREEPESGSSDSFLHHASAFTPKITDFGLAKRLDERGATHTGEVVGTPSYMAPEQAANTRHAVGPATDVYALGAVLYELLTGRPPFKGAGSLDTVLQVLHEEPVRPGRLRPDLPRDLETICLKCLEKDPGRRYATALALALDLRRYLDKRPIKARPVGTAERAWKWARRRPLPTALLAGMVATFLLGFAGITWQWREAMIARDAALAEKLAKEDERSQAEQARAAAVEAQRQEATQRAHTAAALYTSRIAQSQLHWRLNDFSGALRSLERCRPDRRGWEWHYLNGLYHADLFTLRHSLRGAGGRVAFSPDGLRLASVVGGQAVEAGGEGEVVVWDARRGVPLHPWPAPPTLHRLAFRPDGDRLALAGTDGTVQVWDARTGRTLFRERAHADRVADLAYDRSGKRLASAGWDGLVRVGDAEAGGVRHALAGHEGRVYGVAFRPDGLLLASAGGDSTIRLWDTATGRERGVLRGHKGPVYCLAFTPDGKRLASAGSTGNLKVWDLALGQVIQSLTGHAGVVLDIAFSPDGRYLAYGGGDATVRVWDVESGVERVAYRGHTAPVEGVAFSPDGRRLASFSPAQGAVKVWDLTRHPRYATFAHTAEPTPPEAARPTGGPDVEALAFSADGRRLVSVTVGGILQTWDSVTGIPLTERRLPAAAEVVSPAVLASFGPGGRRLAARGHADPRQVQVWDVASGREEVVLRGHTRPVLCVRFSADGRHLATAACDPAGGPHEVRVWDARTGKERAALSGQGRLFNLVFSPDGRLLASAGREGMVRVHDWAAGVEIVRIPGHRRSDVAGLAFAPDGRLLASAGVDDGHVRIWDLARRDRAAAGRPLHDLPAPPFVCDLAFSPDGRRLAGISRDVVKLWDAETGQEALTLRGAPQRHWDPAFNPRLIFSPDGRRLVGTNWDESISIWEAPAPAGPEEQRLALDARRRAADGRALWWHLWEAGDCLAHKNPAAARFHLRQLGEVPLSPPLRDRRDRIARLLDP